MGFFLSPDFKLCLCLLEERREKVIETFFFFFLLINHLGLWNYGKTKKNSDIKKKKIYPVKNVSLEDGGPECI